MRSVPSCDTRAVNVRGSTLQVAIIAAATTGACVKVEKFSFRDGGPQGGEDAGDGGNGSGGGALAYVSTGTYVGELPGMYKLEFSTQGFHFPRTLTIGSTQVLGGTAQTCDTEEGVGILYFPAGQVTSVNRPDISDTLSDIDIDIPGPGVAKVSLEWQGAFTRSGCTGAPQGRSTFTFFPDGRIARMDLTSIAVTNLSGTTCKCGSGGDVNWEVSTYTTFDSTKYTSIIGPNGSIDNPGDNVSVTDPVCMTGAAHQLAVGWRLRPARRARRITSTSVSLFSDFVSPASPGTLSSFPDDGAETTTMWVARTSNCGDLRDRVEPFTGSRELLITQGGVPNSISLGLDGIYGGEHTGSQPAGNGGFDPNPSGGTPITLETSGGANVPPFAVWLDLSANPTIGTLTRTPPSQLPTWYTIQSLGSNEFLLWFPDGLAVGDSITIEVQ